MAFTLPAPSWPSHSSAAGPWPPFSEVCQLTGPGSSALLQATTQYLWSAYCVHRMHKKGPCSEDTSTTTIPQGLCGATGMLGVETKMQMYKRAWHVPRRPSSPGRMENRAGVVGRARRCTGGGSDRLACHTKVLSSEDTEASVNEGVHRPGRIWPLPKPHGRSKLLPHPQLVWGSGPPPCLG